MPFVVAYIYCRQFQTPMRAGLLICKKKFSGVSFSFTIEVQDVSNLRISDFRNSRDVMLIRMGNGST